MIFHLGLFFDVGNVTVEIHLGIGYIKKFQVLNSTILFLANGTCLESPTSCNNGHRTKLKNENIFMKIKTQSKPWKAVSFDGRILAKSLLIISPHIKMS